MMKYGKILSQSKMKKLKELKTYQDETETEVTNKLYCFCQKPYKEGDKMMGQLLL